MTDQELFDACVGHVLRQGKPARTSTGTCRYLTADNLSCAVGGPLVAAGLYTFDMEHAAVNSLVEWYKHGRTCGPREAALRTALTAWGVAPTQYPLLSEIQQAHDRAALHTTQWGSPQDFISAFRGYARDLVYTANKHHNLALNTDILSTTPTQGA